MRHRRKSTLLGQSQQLDSFPRDLEQSGRQAGNVRVSVFLLKWSVALRNRVTSCHNTAAPPPQLLSQERRRLHCPVRGTQFNPDYSRDRGHRSYSHPQERRPFFLTATTTKKERFAQLSESHVTLKLNFSTYDLILLASPKEEEKISIFSPSR